MIDADPALLVFAHIFHHIHLQYSILDFDYLRFIQNPCGTDFWISNWTESFLRG